jgi:hypothetical protein
MNFQVSIMRILSGYPNGLATSADLKRDLAILATSGQDWATRSRKLAAVFPSLDIFKLRFVERYCFGWRLTKKGRIALEMMEDSGKKYLDGGTIDLHPRESQPNDVRPNETAEPDLSSPAAALPPINRRPRLTLIEGGKPKAA